MMDETVKGNNNLSINNCNIQEHAHDAISNKNIVTGENHENIIEKEKINKVSRQMKRKKKVKLYCSICCKYYKSSQAYKNHMITYHDGEPNPDLANIFHQKRLKTNEKPPDETITGILEKMYHTFSNDDQFRCCHCDIVLESFDGLIKHEKWHYQKNTKSDEKDDEVNRENAPEDVEKIPRISGGEIIGVDRNCIVSLIKSEDTSTNEDQLRFSNSDVELHSSNEFIEREQLHNPTNINNDEFKREEISEDFENIPETSGGEIIGVDRNCIVSLIKNEESDTSTNEDQLRFPHSDIKLQNSNKFIECDQLHNPANINNDEFNRKAPPDDFENIPWSYENQFKLTHFYLKPKSSNELIEREQLYNPANINNDEFKREDFPDDLKNIPGISGGKIIGVDRNFIVSVIKSEVLDTSSDEDQL